MESAKEDIKTAGIIIIGNEILSGKVHDSNSFFLVSELRNLGVSVMRISVIPDDVDTIGSEAVAFSKQYDYVFTSGGIGPTHDDVTMKGIARGFGVRLINNAALEGTFRTRYGNAVNEAMLKMAQVPEGSGLIELGDKRFPVICFRNVYIFPGIPEYLREKFNSIRDRFRCAAFYLRRIFLNAEESDIAAALNSVVEESKEVAFGSYPVLDNPQYRIVVTAESRSEERLAEAVKRLLDRLPAEKIVRVE
jgi:molybdenum cofactor synthesis domain-containing protein